MLTVGRIALHFDEEDPRIELIGEFDRASADDLRGAFGAVANRQGRIVIDLTETTFLDSTVLGIVAVACRDNEISVRGATGVARAALETSGLLACVHDEDAHTSTD